MITNQDQYDEVLVNEAVMQVYNLCKYSIITNCLYKIPLSVLEGKSKFKDPRMLCDLIVEEANDEDKEFISQMVSSQMLIQYMDQNYCTQDRNN